MVVSGWSVSGGMRNYDVVTDLVAERVEQTGHSAKRLLLAAKDARLLSRPSGLSHFLGSGTVHSPAA